jgi:hypothetical protein
VDDTATGRSLSHRNAVIDAVNLSQCANSVAVGNWLAVWDARLFASQRSTLLYLFFQAAPDVVTDRRLLCRGGYEMPKRHREQHNLENVGWLRAAVLGANDGMVSTASLILDLTASHATPNSILGAGVAGLLTGAMSMATGEYVSVQSQADTERAALESERLEREENPRGEHHELTGIYVDRGLDPEQATQVASGLRYRICRMH